MIDIFFECDSSKILIGSCSTKEEAIEFIKNDMIEICKKQEPALEIPTKIVNIEYESWNIKFTIIYKVGCYAWSIAKHNPA
jgi:hypothetical protein